MLKLLSALTILYFFASQNAVAASTACSQFFGSSADRATIVKKTNFQLEQLLAEAEAKNEDFSTIQVTGVMKTGSEIASADQASLAGIVNAASKNSVLVINMSQRICITAVPTIQN